MKQLFKFGFLALAFGLIFIGVDTVNAQSWERQKRERREYREEVRDARRDYRNDIRRGENRRDARREYRDEVRDARRDYRRDTGRRVYRGRQINRGYYVNRSRRAYPQNYRVYYRNGRRYIRSY